MLLGLRCDETQLIWRSSWSFDVQGDSIIWSSSWSSKHLTFKLVQQAFSFTWCQFETRVPSLLKALFESAGSLTVSAESSIYNGAREGDGFLFSGSFPHWCHPRGKSFFLGTGSLLGLRDLRHGFSSHTMRDESTNSFIGKVHQGFWMTRQRCYLTRPKLRYQAQLAVY